MMEQKEVEEQIASCKNNLTFYVRYREYLKERGYTEERIMQAVDKHLDRLIELLKLRK
ncbi:MAG: hypothetical protein LBQ74_15310 [Prevotella sp.]|jgi:hypothetical protein|nr:hypothetical protein [Prevotella sp.]